MSIGDFKKLVADDCEGGNEVRKKAKRMRSFVVPPNMIEEGSKEVTDTLITSRSGLVKGRSINIFATFLAETDTDFVTWEDVLGGVDENIVANVMGEVETEQEPDGDCGTGSDWGTTDVNEEDGARDVKPEDEDVARYVKDEEGVRDVKNEEGE